MKELINRNSFLATKLKNKQSIVCFFIVASLYFRWIPIYSGLLLIATLVTVLVFSKVRSINNNDIKLIFLFGLTSLLHLVCITRDWYRDAFHPIFILDILNVTTIALFALFIRTVNLNTFSSKLRSYQISAGVLLASIPSAIITLSFGSTISEVHTLTLASSLYDFVRTNIDYNIMAFLLLLSLNSLAFSKDSKIPAVLFSTIIASGILNSSSRRAFLVLLCLLPLIWILRPSLKLPNLKKVALGIGLAFLISITVLLFAYLQVFKSYLINKAIVEPIVRPLSFVLTPAEFNKIHYKLVHNIRDHSKVSSEHSDFINSLGELAFQPRKNRLKAAYSIASSFSTTQKLFGHSFYLKELGRINKLSIDYPHNFLMTSYISTGAVGVILLVSCILIALIGLFRIKTEWSLEVFIALLITIAFTLTSSFSYWSFLPVSIYTTLGIFAFCSSRRETPQISQI